MEFDRDCHDIGGHPRQCDEAACAGDDGYALLDLSGSLTNLTRVDSVTVPGVSIGHRAAFSWDGDVVIFGHEPGGGEASNWRGAQPGPDKSYFFYETDS